MNSPTRPRQQQQPQSPRDIDPGHGGHRRNDSSRFDSHDDFYAFLDSNRGPPPPGATNPNSGAPMQPPMQAPMPHQSAQNQMQQGQRLPPVPQANQSRPPVTNSFPERSRPPSNTGSRSEEMLVDKNPGAKVARQNGRRTTGNKPSSAPRPTTRAGSPPGPSQWSGGSSPNQSGNQHSRPVSSDDAKALDAAASIQRLKSPSVMDSVLQPLGQKVHEYEILMHQEQDQMSRLDEEIRALQDRRAEAEVRFIEAKSKHDDYRRQYQDVEQAMRGAAPLQREPTSRPQTQQRQIPIHHEEDDDEDDLEDDMSPPYNHNRRIHSQQSFGRTSQKGKPNRFRFSLFGGDR
ncbi:Uu.00g138870.m01.CDS01 [Anthostomella pinea]|uniref:Uu.00g138870.m01.CDS01 n=1 Tax=Anthostomella pinea TaxID=933095 RepID=A0AAI8VPQ9_9PEZI|nr:Uu.00g138870.m01.CDS01 [Anthostomella pinea]